MATKSNGAAAESAEPTPARVSVRILKNGVHAGRLILGRGAVVSLPQAEADALVAAGSALSLN